MHEYVYHVQANGVFQLCICLQALLTELVAANLDIMQVTVTPCQ